MYELICAGLLCKTKNLVTVGRKNPLLTEQKEILNSGFQMSMPLEYLRRILKRKQQDSSKHISTHQVAKCCLLDVKVLIKFYGR